MTKSEFVTAVAGKTGLSINLVKCVINSALETVEDEVKNGDGVSFTGFGTFKKEWRNESEARSPRTGEKIKVPGRYVCKFKVGKGLKDAVAEIKK